MFMVANSESGRRRRSSDSTPSLGTVFELLSRERRRIVLEALIEHRRMGMADLAEAVACAEQGISFDELSEDEILEVYTDLWHTDVPKLDDGGLINYDQERDLVTLAPAADEIDGFIF